MILNQHHGLNPILSRIIYWFNGWCNILDGLIVVITLGCYYPMLAQRFAKVRMWFIQIKSNKRVLQQYKDKKRNNVACEIYTKKKRKGYTK